MPRSRGLERSSPALSRKRARGLFPPARASTSNRVPTIMHEKPKGNRLNSMPIALQIAEAAGEIRRRWNCRPAVGIILGTGLGSFTEEIEAEDVLGYEEIPHFMRSTAIDHKGQLVCGRVAGVP